jgi:hypothetical protein
MKKNRNKYLLIILLVILLSAVGYYLFPKNKKMNPLDFTLQGQTELNAGTIVMKVWDHEAEDGDSIQVYFEGKLIEDSLAILNNPVEYKLGKLSAGEYWLGVKAINEGMVSPASAHISLNDGKTEKEFNMDAWIDSAASWKVILK